MSGGAVAVAPPAKNVVVYRNGDPFFHGRKFVVNQRRLLTFEAFLNEVTNIVQAPMAVRSIYTPRQGHRVTGLGELQNGCQYVAAGFERFKRMDYLNPGMKQPEGTRKKDGIQNYPVISRRASVLARWKRQVNLPCVIHVFRNGDLLSPPFRLVLTNSTLQDWSTILNLLSERANLRSGAVRKLCKLNGDAVANGEELANGDYYVAVGLERYKSLPYVELLVPQKTAHRPFRNLPNRRRSQKRGYGKLHPPSQDGASDSALLEPRPQLDSRRTQSTGVVEKENRSTSSPLVHNQAGKHPHRDEEDSIFYAKPVRVGRISQNSLQSSDQEESSIYKMKGARTEVKDAQEVGEDEDTQVELPVDQKAAETVEEEVMPNVKVLPHSQVENTDKLQNAHSTLHSADDSGDEMARGFHFRLPQRNFVKFVECDNSFDRPSVQCCQSTEDLYSCWDGNNYSCRCEVCACIYVYTYCKYVVGSNDKA